MTTRISASMLRSSLTPVTIGWFDKRHLPPPTVQGYAPLVDELRDRLATSADLPWLVLGLRHVLATPSIAAAELVNSRFGYSEREARELLAFIVTRLPPVADPPDPVELEPMEPQDWTALRSEQPAPALVQAASR